MFPRKVCAGILLILPLISPIFSKFILDPARFHRSRVARQYQEIYPSQTGSAKNRGGGRAGDDSSPDIATWLRQHAVKAGNSSGLDLKVIFSSLRQMTRAEFPNFPKIRVYNYNFGDGNEKELLLYNDPDLEKQWIVNIEELDMRQNLIAFPLGDLGFGFRKEETFVILRKSHSKTDPFHYIHLAYLRTNRAHAKEKEVEVEWDNIKPQDFVPIPISFHTEDPSNHCISRKCGLQEFIFGTCPIVRLGCSVLDALPVSGHDKERMESLIRERQPFIYELANILTTNNHYLENADENEKEIELEDDNKGFESIAKQMSETTDGSRNYEGVTGKVAEDYKLDDSANLEAAIENGGKGNKKVDTQGQGQSQVGQNQSQVGQGQSQVGQNQSQVGQGQSQVGQGNRRSTRLRAGRKKRRASSLDGRRRHPRRYRGKRSEGIENIYDPDDLHHSVKKDQVDEHFAVGSDLVANLEIDSKNKRTIAEVRTQDAPAADEDRADDFGERNKSPTTADKSSASATNEARPVTSQAKPSPPVTKPSSPPLSYKVRQPPSVANEAKPSSPPATYEAGTPPPVANESTPSSPVTSEAQPSPTSTNETTPSSPVTSEATPSPPVTSEAKPLSPVTGPSETGKQPEVNTNIPSSLDLLTMKSDNYSSSSAGSQFVNAPSPETKQPNIPPNTYFADILEQIRNSPPSKYTLRPLECIACERMGTFLSDFEDTILLSFVANNIIADIFQNASSRTNLFSPDAYDVLRAEPSIPYIGYGTCDFSESVLSHRPLSTEMDDLIVYYTESLGGNCHPKLGCESQKIKKKLREMLTSKLHLLEIWPDMSIRFNKSSALPQNSILSTNEFQEFMTALIFAAYTEQYRIHAAHYKDNRYDNPDLTNRHQSPRMKFQTRIILRVVDELTKNYPQHLIKGLRYLLQILQDKYLSLVAETIGILEYPFKPTNEKMDFYRITNKNDRLQVIALKDFLINGVAPLTRSGSGSIPTFITFFHRNFKRIQHSFVEYGIDRTPVIEGLRSSELIRVRSVGDRELEKVFGELIEGVSHPGQRKVKRAMKKSTKKPGKATKKLPKQQPQKRQSVNTTTTTSTTTKRPKIKLEGDNEEREPVIRKRVVKLTQL